MSDFYPSSYMEGAAHQLREWCEGRPYHNPYSPDGAHGPERTDGECCPDFSCCKPENIWSKERRYAFLAASGADRERMLFGALFNLVDPDKTYIAGAEEPKP